MAVNTYCIIVTKGVIGKSGEGRTKGGTFRIFYHSIISCFLYEPSHHDIVPVRADLLFLCLRNFRLVSCNCCTILSAKVK